MTMLKKLLKKYFVPHGENGYKPHFLRFESILFFFMVIVVVEFGFLVQVFIVFDKTNFLASVLPAVLTDLTNEERAQNDAPPLVQNDLLNKAAQMKAEDMASHQYFAHTSPEGKTPWYWFGQVGYNFSSAGENLAVNFFESGDVANAWMNSPTHRANIVKKGYKEIGIGVANGIYKGQNTVFVAQLFGTPIIINPKPTPPVETKKEMIKIPIVKPLKIIPRPKATQVLGEETSSIVTAIDASLPSSIELFIGKALTSPREYVNYIYISIAVLLMLAVSLVFFIKSKIKHPLVIIRGLALIAIIVALFIVNTNIDVLQLKTNVITTDITAGAINIAF